MLCFLAITKQSYYLHESCIKNSNICLFGQRLFFFLLNFSTSSDEMVSEDDYEIWILPQELQSVDINLQSFWSNWCSAEEECNTSCCDVPCILFSTVSGHACHSPLLRHCGYNLVTLRCDSSETETEGASTCLPKKQQKKQHFFSNSITTRGRVQLIITHIYIPLLNPYVLKFIKLYKNQE